MTTKQKILQWIYPLLMKLTGAKATILHNADHTPPNTSFYSLHADLINGEHLSFGSLKGKKVVLVNTASDCGYTAQYTELQQLQEQYKELVIIGFPANDFKQQEKEDNAAIAAFCQKNFGVEFPLAKKSSVVKSNAQNKVFQWLSHSKLNGWNNQPPSWNFSKYIINEKGILTHYFGPSVSPLSSEVEQAISL